MPKNKSAATDDSSNESRLRAQARTPRLEKMSRLPPSLNRINKNLP